MKLFLILAAAAAALVFGTSQANPRGWVPCHLRFVPVRCAVSTAANPPVVKDVNSVIAAAYRDHLDETLLHLYLAVNRARAASPKGTSEWALIIETEVAGLAQRAGELSDAARARVAAVEVETAAGHRFRAVVLRGLRRQGISNSAFAHEIAANRSTLKAFERWGTRLNAMRRWYANQLEPVLAATAPGDRQAAKAALLRY
jgi:hypothetical protein